MSVYVCLCVAVPLFVLFVMNVCVECQLEMGALLLVPRRVFTTDDCDELTVWLNFVNSVVDSAHSAALEGGAGAHDHVQGHVRRLARCGLHDPLARHHHPCVCAHVPADHRVLIAEDDHQVQLCMCVRSAPSSACGVVRG